MLFFFSFFTDHTTELQQLSHSMTFLSTDPFIFIYLCFIIDAANEYFTINNSYLGAKFKPVLEF